ncbi:MAG: Flp family type IVb pilin [Acidimicrobiales bacterium]
MNALQQFHTWILAWSRVEARQDDRGASLVEYALLLALIAMVCIAAVSALGATTSDSFSEAVSMLG